MKKIIVITLAVILIPLVAWLMFRDSSTPLVETIIEGLPFGTGEDINIPALSDPNATLGEATSFDQPSTEQRVIRISNTPVAGFVSLTQGSTTIIRYVDRATGHIYNHNLNTGEKIKIVNQTLPKIYEAYFRADGGAVLLRSLVSNSDKGENITLTLTPPRSASSTEQYAVSSAKLRDDMDSVAVGNGNTLYYVAKDTSSVISSTFTGTEVKTLFNSAFDSWRTFKLGSGVGVYSKASASLSGIVYSLNGSALSKVVGPFRGLTAVGHPSVNRIIYSYYEGGRTKLFFKNIGQTGDLEILPASLAEKCVFSNKNTNVFFCGTPVNGISGTEPDSWYAGTTHFADHVWKFDTSSEISQLIVEPKAEFDLDLDIYEPKLSPNEDFLIFINKRDMTLWAIKL